MYQCIFRYINNKVILCYVMMQNAVLTILRCPSKYHPSHVNECKFPEELSPGELSTTTVTTICIVQKFLARINAGQSLLFYRIQRFF